jgi:hypothetical protein
MHAFCGIWVHFGMAKKSQPRSKAQDTARGCGTGLKTLMPCATESGGGVNLFRLSDLCPLDANFVALETCKAITADAPIDEVNEISKD